jgi:N-acetyl-gamma-glutamyl-phosphate reductase
MIRVGILGATGYTALELAKLLVRHPEAEITVATSRQEGEPHIAMVHPQLAGRLDIRLQDPELMAVAANADCVFCCLPHGASAESVVQLLQTDTRVIDLSADYRLSSPQVYEQWYGHKHPDPGRLGEVPYGLGELFAQQIAGSQLVANPGCYPTSAILALAPLLAEGLVESDDIIIDSKSGVSGAGRTPKLTTHFPECNESVSAYNIGRHRHTPEIEQVLTGVAGKSVPVVFTPHLIPMDRGILTTAYSRPKEASVTEERLLESLRGFYRDKPFVRVVDHMPATKDTTGTNFCDITARIVRDRVITISCLDNLIKGASGAAVQNFNLMYGFPETMAL